MASAPAASLPCEHERSGWLDCSWFGPLGDFYQLARAEAVAAGLRFLHKLKVMNAFIAIEIASVYSFLS
jgi:hypothetical protein